MPNLRKTIESVHYAASNENSANQDQETNKEETDLAQETRASVEATLEKSQPKSATNILRDFARELQGRQKKIILHIARKTARTHDFGTSEFNKVYKIGTNNIQSVFNFLFKNLEKLGLKKIKTTEITKPSRKNHYLIVKLISDPSEKPKTTSKNKIKNSGSQYQKVTRSLDFIPNKLHETLLFLTLSSKYGKWVDYNEISRETGQSQKTSSAQIQVLRELLPKTGVILLEEKSKRGTKYFHLATPSKSKEKRKKFREEEKKKQEKKQLPNNKATKTHRVPKRTKSTSDVIQRNWPKRNPKDEWYDDDNPKNTPRKLWEDASGKGGSA